ncbi:HIT family protein [Seohaeicola zhoushanensis]|uniref:Hydrolase n=1 Tax=Seohaeicola zhoushanensis TaxID=1569283 RepID=A0A8J3M5N9_9RHOB|nr:HIT family protein [Seohaeicola zhoushanensis]GHF37437.1 hydrolase [Seohaeicola zhoushanensis]
MSYDPDNVFAKILRGEIPSTRIYEDEATLAFMDIMPRTDGHCLVIPKTPCRNALDASPEQLAAVIATTQKVARAAMAGLGVDGVVIEQYNEAPAGQEVFHLHFHVLPMREGVRMRPPGKMGDFTEIAGYAEKIRAGLA